MSTCPGTTLEDYLMWRYNLIVDGDSSANLSLQIAEAMGVKTARKRITAAEFAPLVELFEPHRRKIEWRLEDCSEDESGSWRDYAGFAFDFLPGDVIKRGEEISEQSSRWG